MKEEEPVAVRRRGQETDLANLSSHAEFWMFLNGT